MKAIENGTDTITFDETVSLGASGSHFGGPINDDNTIKLTFGEINVEDIDDPTDAIEIANVQILGPKSFDGDKDYVMVERTGAVSANLDDFSVFDITIARLQPGQPNFPDYSPSFALGGLLITGGTAEVGAGVNASGPFNLNINQCDIVGNVCTNQGPFSEATAGGGVAATPFLVGGAGDGKSYGPHVTISNSLILDNRTVFDDDGTDPQPGVGGGVYVVGKSKLSISNSIIMMNGAENGGGGVYFAGESYYEDPIDSVKHFTPSYLKINYCDISGNSSNSSNSDSFGGGLVIATPTGGMIADSTFANNFATSGGGGVYLTGQGTPLNNQPYSPLVGTVAIVACTFEKNHAGVASTQQNPARFANGAGIRIDGIVNGVHIADCTLSANTVVGKGGGVSMSPSELTYGYSFIFDNAFNVDYNARLITAKTGLDIPSATVPGQIAGETHIEFLNSTITGNEANGEEIEVMPGVMELFGARGGGIAVDASNSGSLPGLNIAGSTIVAKNSISPSKGFGHDLYASDDTMAGLVFSHPVNYSSGTTWSESRTMVD